MNVTMVLLVLLFLALAAMLGAAAVVFSLRLDDPPAPTHPDDDRPGQRLDLIVVIACLAIACGFIGGLIAQSACRVS